MSWVALFIHFYFYIGIGVLVFLVCNWNWYLSLVCTWNLYNVINLKSVSHIQPLCCRYFQCVPLFGLFAPVQKVVKAMGVTAPATRRASLNKCSLSALGGGPRSRSGSQESISSIGSSISNVSGRGRVRLGVVSLGNQVLLLAAVL